MKSIGYLLITLGFLGGSYLSVRQSEEVEVVPFLLALAVGVGGVALVRTIQHRDAHHEERLTANIQTIARTLTRLAQDARTLEEEMETVDVYDLRHRIDQTFLADLDAFVEARESIAHSFGLNAYAEVMNHFAAGERYLRRVWSASTDGYVDEAREYVTRAREQFEGAAELFVSLGEAAPAGTGAAR